MLIVKPVKTQMNICIMSNGKKRWLVITDNSGGWILHKEITQVESNELRALGMEYNLDRGMSHPDDPDSYK